MQHLALGQPTSLRIAFIGDDENRLDLSGVTVTVRDDLEQAVATNIPAAEGSPADGIWTAPLTTAQVAGLGIRTETWTATLAAGGTITRTRTHEVVGQHLFEIADLRAFETDFANPGRWTPTLLANARDHATTKLHELCQASFHQRRQIAHLDGDDTQSVLLPEMPVARVDSVSVDGVDLTPTQVADLIVYEWGALYRPADLWPRGRRNIAVAYVHGNNTVLQPIAEAAMILARDVLIASPIPDRALVETTDLGQIRYSQPGRDGPTGFPRVDAIIAQFAGRRITVG